MCMSILSTNYSSSVSRAFRRVWNKVPSVTIANKKALKGIKWVGEHISSPENRLILGVSALMSQPFIDLSNKRVDEETRKTSAARTIAKIIAGTSTGYLVRWASIKAIEKMTKVPQKNHVYKWWETFFSPDRAKVAYRSLGHYKNALGTILALGVMLITNFAIDAPFTKFLTNKFIGVVKKNDAKKNTAQNKGNDPLNTPPEPKAEEAKKPEFSNLIQNKVNELQKNNANQRKDGQ